MSQDDVFPVKMSKVSCLVVFHDFASTRQLTLDVFTGNTYIIPTHDTHQWLLLQFLVLLMMGA